MGTYKRIIRNSETQIVFKRKSSKENCLRKFYNGRHTAFKEVS